MTKRILTGLLLLGALTGCVYDHLVPEGCAVEEGKYYLSFVLNSSSAATETRAFTGGMDIGRTPGEEVLVSKVALYFYDAGGAPQGGGNNKKEFTAFSQYIAAPAQQDSTVSSIVGKVGDTKSDIVVELPFRPYSMLVCLNMDKDLKGLRLEAAREAMLESAGDWQGAQTTISYKGTDYNVKPFRMSSSTYLTSGGAERCAVPIPDDYIWTTEQDARDHAALKVYVDRMAAKVNVYKKGATEYPVPIVTQYEGIKAKVKLLGWGLNGLNKKSHCYKKIDPAWSFTKTNWGVDWNESDKFRCHWSIDPNYGGTGYTPAGTYPKHSGEIYGGAKIYTEDAVDLQYLSWKDLVKDPAAPAPTPFSAEKDKDKTNNPMYCFENTADGSILRTDLAYNELFPRLTHVLVAAQLIFEAGTGLSSAGDVAGYTTAGATFYRYKGVFYTENNIAAAIASDLRKVPYYKDATQTELVDASCVNGITLLHGEVCYPVLSGVFDGSGNSVDADALKSTYRIDKFTEGYFYYKIPIEHLEPEPSPLGGNYPTAQYGVVRNHNYIIEIADKLEAIGTGIGNEGEPIVPVREDRDYIVSVRISVSNWKQMDTRFVFVDPSGMLITNGQLVDRLEDGDLNMGWENQYGWYF